MENNLYMQLNLLFMELELDPQMDLLLELDQDKKLLES